MSANQIIQLKLWAALDQPLRQVNKYPALTGVFLWPVYWDIITAL